MTPLAGRCTGLFGTPMRRHKNELAKENEKRRTTKIEDTSISPYKQL
jgi:hypothetical protein